MTDYVPPGRRPSTAAQRLDRREMEGREALAKLRQWRIKERAERMATQRLKEIHEEEYRGLLDEELALAALYPWDDRSPEQGEDLVRMGDEVRRIMKERAQRQRRSP